MALRIVLLLFSLVGSGLCWMRPLNFPDVGEKWPAMPKPGLEVANPEANPIVCEVCEVLVEEIQTLLGNDSKKVIALLDEFCDLLPPDYNATCKEYVDEWTPIIIDFLENQSPAEVCADLTLCSATAVTRPENRRFSLGHMIRHLHKSLKRNFNKLMIRNALGNNFLCDGCNEVVTMLNNLLTSPQVLDELVMLLEEGCVLCPGPVEDQCRAYFQKLPAVIRQFVDQYLNNQTCKNIGLCPASGRDNVFDMFDHLFSGLLPDNFDRDFISGRPWSGRRPRPNTEPAPRGHPYRPFWDRHDGERPYDRPRPGHHDRPGHHGRPDHHDRPHNRSDGHGRPHHGPHHHPDGVFPRPDIRPWWKPGMKPYRPRPWGGKPALPEEPMIPEAPEAEIPEVEIPNFDIPVNDELPNVDIPVNIEVPEFEIPNVNVPGVKPRPQSKPWDRWPTKSRSSRRQRSVLINTVINTGDFDQATTFDVSPTEMDNPMTNPVKSSWQCDVCEYEVEVIQKYVENNKDAIMERLLSLVDGFCDQLPPTSTAECKTEFANLLPPFVDMIIQTYLTPDTVCSALQVC